MSDTAKTKKTRAVGKKAKPSATVKTRDASKRKAGAKAPVKTRAAAKGRAPVKKKVAAGVKAPAKAKGAAKAKVTAKAKTGVKAKSVKPKATVKPKAAKAKTPVKSRAAVKTKAATKPKAAVKSKSAVKPKSVTKPKSTAKKVVTARQKEAAKRKVAAKAKTAAKPKAPAKPKAAVKPKAIAKPKATAKSKVEAVKVATPPKPSKPARPKPPPVPQIDVQKYLAELDRLGMKLGLARINKLLDALGNPQRKIKTIHVVGTNGKSSTARMIAAILASQGLKAGAYLSPHLVAFTERFLINGKEISEPRFDKLILDVRKKAEEVNKRSRSSGPLTQFEILTAAAFVYFHQQKVDCAVIEAGLGGRYDATNVIDSKVQVLTNIELEHTDLLGKTISAILKEKTAVIPEKGNVVLGALSPEALKEAKKICLAKNAKVQVYDDDFSLLRGSGEKFDVMTGKHSYEDLQMALVGHYQRTNCTMAIQAAELFMRKGLDEKKMKRALPRITIPGRLEIIDEKPLVVLDGAHNPSGIAELIESLQPLVAGKRIIGVVSILKDKDASGMLGQLLEFCDILFVTENSNPRCMTAQELSRLQVVAESHVQTFVARESQSALESAFKLASMRDVILVTGSLYLLSDIKKRMA
ncbi:MAG: glutamate ligase domain-containing protein [Thermoleophilia bacterium]